jgi:hypothetical protein
MLGLVSFVGVQAVASGDRILGTWLGVIVGVFLSGAFVIGLIWQLHDVLRPNRTDETRGFEIKTNHRPASGELENKDV